MNGQRPFTILIAALGGEGGGVLADWLLAAAHAQGFPAQSTSIPGVSQRTGATTYYLEILPQAGSHSATPVMALIPSPGAVDLVAASELVEAGRALQNAFVTPERTTLVASSHRIFATAEKMLPTDGRYDAQRILDAAPQLSRRAIIFDMQHLARDAGTIINAVLFGAMAGSGVLPLPVSACEAAIRGGGKGAEASLRGFALGLARAKASAAPVAQFAAERELPSPVARVHLEFPANLHQLLDRCVARLIDYQDQAYASLYLDRVRAILAVEQQCDGADPALASEAARLLALWMSYEDVVRVAELKTRATRFDRLRQETGSRPGQVLRVFDYLKPGLQEIADVLPPRLAALLHRWHKARPLALSMQLQTSSIRGFLMMRALTLAKPFRRASSRFIAEQATIERWLGALQRLGAAFRDRELVLEIAQCARLLRGYGDTQRRGQQALQNIFATLLENEAAASAGAASLRAGLHAAVAAALADPDARIPAAVPKGVIWLKAG